MTPYSIEPRTRNYVKGYGFLPFGRKLSNKHGIQLLDNATKTRFNALKSATKKVTHKAVKKIVKAKVVPDENSRNFEEIIISTEKREEILNELGHIL